jgi:hypothetical protein
VETADGSGNMVGSYDALAIDGQGNPHVSYYDQSTGQLKYARKAGGVWTRETVDPTVDRGRYTSIAVDGSGNAHISYYDATNGNLRYARKAGGVWTLEVADGAAGDVGAYSSVALDVEGGVHISYQDVTAGDLKYIQKSAGAWLAAEVAEASANVLGLNTCIRLDPLGQPHITYADQTAGDVRYARKLNGTWTREIVDGATSVAGPNNSLVLDAQGNPHVAYRDAPGNGDLDYARKTTGTWTRETVDASIEDAAPGFASFALDPYGNPVAAYFDATSGDLRIADSGVHLLSPGGGETWPVGSPQTIRWSGVGPVTISFSPDGGTTLLTLQSGVLSNLVAVRVPHTPTRFGRILISRSSPLAAAESDSFFQVDATIALLEFQARILEEGEGIALTWRTDPGPEADVRYRIERAAAGEAFAPVHAGLLSTGALVDRDLIATARYRIVAVNGLGEEYALGETALSAALSGDRDISVYPNPARGGEARILFRVPSERPVELAIYDASGRRVRSLTAGAKPAGVQSVSWDGRDENGSPVAAGTYIARLSSGRGFEPSERLVVIR